MDLVKGLYKARHPSRPLHLGPIMIIARMLVRSRCCQVSPTGVECTPALASIAARDILWGNTHLGLCAAAVEVASGRASPLPRLFPVGLQVPRRDSQSRSQLYCLSNAPSSKECGVSWERSPLHHWHASEFLDPQGTGTVLLYRYHGQGPSAGCITRRR